MVTPQPVNQRGIQRLGKAGIGHGDRGTGLIKLIRGQQRILQAGPKRKDSQFFAFTNNPALADFEQPGRIGDGTSRPLTPRVTEGGRPFIKGSSRRNNTRQLRLIRRGHDRHVGQAGQKGQIIGPDMGCPVSPDQPGPVNGETHRQFLQGDIMDNLIIPALQEGGIERGKRLHPLSGETGGESHGMLFGNTNIKTAARETLAEFIQPGA